MAIDIDIDEISNVIRDPAKLQVYALNNLSNNNVVTIEEPSNPVNYMLEMINMSSSAKTVRRARGVRVCASEAV